MGYAFGQNNNGREIGYGVEAICDQPGCEEEIDHGIAYCCGGVDGIQNAGMDGEPYCGGFFCGKHLYAGGVCEKCLRKCPDCHGEGVDDEGEDCLRCDGGGELGHPEPRVHFANLIADRFGLSRSEARRLIAQGAVKLDGKVAEDFDYDGNELRGKTLAVGKSRSVQL
jgi:hypothetical protein